MRKFFLSLLPTTHHSVRDGDIGIASLDDLELVPLHRQPGPPTSEVSVRVGRELLPANWVKYVRVVFVSIQIASFVFRVFVQKGQDGGRKEPRRTSLSFIILSYPLSTVDEGNK